jgi:PAS domain S-box-containing protein
MAGAFALSRHITRPLRALTEAASAVSRGDYSRLTGIRQNDEVGKLAATFDVMVDKLRNSQRELERKVQEQTLLLDAAPSAMLGVDERGRIVLANNQAERLFGYTQDELSERPIEMLIPERFRVTHADHRAGFFQQPSSRPMGAGRDLYGVRKDGSEFPVEIGLNPLATERGMMVLSTIVDITERKRAEEKLREQAAMLNQAQEAILVREMDGGIRFWNRGAERLYGWQAEEVLDRPVSELLNGGDSSELDDTFKVVVEKGEWRGEIRQFTKDGRELTVEAHWTLIRDEQGHPKSVLAINTDITEKKKLEAQFLRAQRLESLGTLAGGIAHDLNNILSPVLMGVQMLQMKFTDAGEQRLLEIMRGNVERGAEMIKQILLFTRGVQGERVPLQPKQIIKETVKIIGETFPKSIEIKFFIPEELALVSGDATQLQQVLMNLCVNARDAMPHGGRLLIEAVNTAMDEQQAAFAPDARPGQYVRLLISDTGTGIPEEVKDKIFDPFFTTKELGKGTGLGLSTALGIVKSHKGFIHVYSEAGQGTKFTVYLPAHTAGRTAQLAAKQVEMPAGRGELILVVDDEASVREITRATLESFGYRVLLASDGTDALALYAQHGSEIQAVLTDAMMPYMDGPATIRALQQLNQQIKVIASSGLAEQERVSEMAALGVSHFLPKPYTADRLLKLLAQALQCD